MRSLLRRWDFLVLAVLISAFVYAAAQRLGTIPVPETDEAYTLQVPYEMLYRGKLALPMFRYLGGNIENVWHSYTPVYFVVLSTFFKWFGWGLLQGRVFNLITAVLTLLMVYLIGRRLFDWRAGLAAVVMLVSDQVFFERSRLLRNDFAAAALALFAFYLFEIAEQQKRRWLYVASGLAAGAGVMCHTNGLYMLGVIGLLMFFRRGWRLFSTSEPYLFAASAFLVMAYEVIYILVDFQNFLLQNRDDKLHFHVLSWEGIQRNILKEPGRYDDWIRGGSHLMGEPGRLLLIFQILTPVAIVYLAVRCIRAIRRGEGMSETRTHILVATLVVILFIGLVGGNKGIYYLAHLIPWFAICVGILLRDGINQLGRLRVAPWPRARLVHAAAIGLVLIVSFIWGRTLERQYRHYIRATPNPDVVSFEETKSVLRSIVPEGLCPVAMKGPVIWLFFPEQDRCFASIEERMADAVDIEGKDYAVILPNARLQSRTAWKEELDERHHPLGVLRDTAYGDLVVYYTGVDPRYRSITPREYRFFGDRRGHYTDEQLSQARTIWSVGDTTDHGGGPPDGTARGILIESPAGARGVTLVEIGSIDLTRDTIYQLRIETNSATSSWELVVVNPSTGEWLSQPRLPEHTTGRMATDSFFKTIGTERIKLALHPLQPAASSAVEVKDIAVREVAPLWSDGRRAEP